MCSGVVRSIADGIVSRKIDAQSTCSQLVQRTLTGTVENHGLDKRVVCVVRMCCMRFSVLCAVWFLGSEIWSF